MYTYYLCSKSHDADVSNVCLEPEAACRPAGPEEGDCAGGGPLQRNRAEQQA